MSWNHGAQWAPMVGRLAAIAGTLLILIGIPWLIVGAISLWVGVDNARRVCEGIPPCRYPQFAAYLLILAAIVVPIGLAHLVAGIGTLRRSKGGARLGLAISAIGAVGAAWIALAGFYPGNQSAMLVAVSLIPYLIALGLLVFDRRRTMAV
jgi:hypothetical protein